MWKNYDGLEEIHVLGDSQVIIDWVMEKSQVLSLELFHWLNDSRRMMNEFNSLSFNHIFCEMNFESNALSKTTLDDMDGSIYLSICMDGICERTDTMVFSR